MALPHLAVSLIAGFSASLVESIEALTVVLAVGVVRGWRSALSGTGLALACLILSVLILGPGIARIPLGPLHLLLGAMLLLFGLRWLRKAVLRAAGVLAQRDEAASYAKESAKMRMGGASRGLVLGLDAEALATAFKITLIEGVEVIFIVLTIGAGARDRLLAGSAGALCALLVVVALGFLLRGPITRVPENSLKFGVGVMLSGFGTFWTGEGIGVDWPGDDWSLVALIAGWLAAAFLAVRLAKPRRLLA